MRLSLDVRAGWWVVLLAVCVASCAGARSGPSDGGNSSLDAGPPPTAAQYCESTVDFFCPYYLRCGRMAVADGSECRAVFLESCRARYQDRYAALENAGLLSLSADGMQACRQHLATVACDQQLRDLDGPCAAMWTGHQPLGGACGLDVESLVCAPGSACVLDLSFCGSCRAVAAPGASCGGDVTCGDGASCDNALCVPRVMPGAGCSDGGRCVVGASCVSGTCQGPRIVAVDDACDQTHRCPYKSTCISGTCHEAALQGAPCSTTTPCASGFCSSGTCVAPGAVGSACDRADQCSSSNCVGGTCAALPDHCFTVDGGP